MDLGPGWGQKGLLASTPPIYRPWPLCPVLATPGLPALISTDFPLESHPLLRLVVAVEAGGLQCGVSRLVETHCPHTHLQRRSYGTSH